jgi:hypothetical protein
MKILIIGYARHGKDTVAEYLQKAYNMSFRSSSMHCAEKAIMPELSAMYGYQTVEECFNDRMNHRSEWFDLISEYCKNDLARIGREIFDVSDIYCGLRNKREFHAIKNNGLFDHSIWVDRSDYLPPEDKKSNTLEPWMADYTVDNNGSLEQLYRNVDDLMKYLGVTKKSQ